MTGTNAKFNDFLELERQIPLGLRICSKDNFEIIFNGELPVIRDEELEKCLLFIHSGFTKKLKQLKDECISKIEQNTFDLSNEQLHKYLILISNRLNNAMKYLGLVSHLGKLRNSNILEIHKSKFEAFSPIQRANYSIICLFYVDVNECYNCYFAVKDFIAERQSELNKILHVDKNTLSKSGPKLMGLTHRQEAIIRKYKIDAKVIPNEYYRTEIRKQFGKKREQAIDSVNEVSKTYTPITTKELQTIIPYLEEYPNAQKAAINDLHKLN
jgi:hypothetical protein